jgi:hypothetical protein
MFAFSVYAVIVWYLAAHWRRTWASFATVAGALAVLVFIAYLHYLLSVWTDGRIYLPVLRSLLYPYTVLVGVIGLYLACLPAAIPARGAECPRCRYDLRGLEDETNSCPECGTPFMIAGGAAVAVYAEPISYPPLARRPAPTRAKRDRQRRRPGPPPVVLRWPPIEADAAAPATAA